jgi:hypothetical protein
LSRLNWAVKVRRKTTIWPKPSRGILELAKEKGLKIILTMDRLTPNLYLDVVKIRKFTIAKEKADVSLRDVAVKSQ